MFPKDLFAIIGVPKHWHLDNNIIYYMAGATSGQDEANPVFWLATRGGKMGLSCPLGIARFGPANKKIAWSRLI